MIENAALLKAAASEIDAHDAIIREANDAKKDVFGNVRESVAPEIFKAWKDAVKLRQKRRVDRDALEAHDARVWEVLQVLERETPQPTAKTAVAPVSGPANAQETETPLTRARLDPGHDPETGEIVPLDAAEDVSALESAPVAPRAAEEGASFASAAHPSADMPDLPAFLDRAARAA